jgi:hypothetical protein
VAHEFIRAAQPTGVENHRPIHHHGVGQAAALRETGSAQPRHVLGKGKGAGIGKPFAEGERGDAECQRLAADGRIGEVDLEFGVEGRLAPGQEFGEGPVRLVDPDGAQQRWAFAVRPAPLPPVFLIAVLVWLFPLSAKVL